MTAEHPVDIQVYLRDVLGGDQGLLCHLYGKTGEEEQASGIQTLTCLKLLCWAGSPGATMGVCPAEPPSFLWEAGDGGSAHRACGTCVRACAQLLWAGW